MHHEMEDSKWQNHTNDYCNLVAKAQMLTQLLKFNRTQGNVVSSSTANSSGHFTTLDFLWSLGNSKKTLSGLTVFIGKFLNFILRGCMGP